MESEARDMVRRGPPDDIGRLLRSRSAPARDGRGSRPPHWWAPCLVNHVLRRMGYPLGEAVARATARSARGLLPPAPTVLLRVDDYPHWTVPLDRFWEFHRRLASAKVRYLLSATPFLTRHWLDDSPPERALEPQDWSDLAAAVERGELEVGLHGLTHASRSPSTASEFDGMSVEEVRARLAAGWQFLADKGCRPVAFVPPFNCFAPALWQALPRECGVMCLGPESVRDTPLLRSPTAYDGRAIVYSLPPFYGKARDILRALRKGRWLDRPFSVIPITVHWAPELEDGFAAVTELAHYVGERAELWSSALQRYLPTQLPAD